MLMQLRQKTAKVFTFMLFGLLVLSFAVWGIGDIFRVDGSNPEIAEVGDTRIDQQSFSRNLNQEMNALRQRFGPEFDVAQAVQLGVVNQVLQQMINQALIDERSRQMGLVVTDEEIQRQIINEPQFQVDGVFQRQLFFNTLRNNGISEERYVELLRGDVRREQLARALVESVSAPTLVADTIFGYDEERRVAEMLLVPAGFLPEGMVPEDSELQALLDANPDQFSSPEFRAVTLLFLRTADMAEEIAIPEADLKAEYDARADEFRQPERRSIVQMVFADEEQANNAQRRLSIGEPFKDVSQAILGNEGISLGQVSYDQMALQLPELADAAFALSAGGTSDVVQTPFGWHILFVEDVTPATEPTFEDVRDRLAQELAEREAVDSLVAIANQLDDELAAGTSLEEAARVLQLEVETISAIDARGEGSDGTPVAGLPPADLFLPLVQRTRSGETSLLIETREGDYFVLRVDGITPPRRLTLDEAREDVTELWRQDRLIERAEERAEGLAERAKSGESLEEIGATEDLNVENTGPIDRRQNQFTSTISADLVAALFAARPGDIVSAPSFGGYAVARLDEIIAADRSADPETFEAIENDLKTAFQSDLLGGFLTTLQGEVGVTVNQQALNDLLARQ